MSATSEAIFDQIRDAETALAEARVNNDQVLIDSLQRDLTVLQKRHAASIEALNEGRQVIKG